MLDDPRLVTVQLELRYVPTPEEQAVFDRDDEDAQAAADQAVLRSVMDLLDGPSFAASRFQAGAIKASTGSSWSNRFSS